MAAFVRCTACCTSRSDHRKFRGQTMQPAAEMAMKASSTLCEFAPATHTLLRPALQALWQLACIEHDLAIHRAIRYPDGRRHEKLSLYTYEKLELHTVADVSHQHSTATRCPGVRDGTNFGPRLADRSTRRCRSKAQRTVAAQNCGPKHLHSLGLQDTYFGDLGPGAI